MPKIRKSKSPSSSLSPFLDSMPPDQVHLAKRWDDYDRRARRSRTLRPHRSNWWNYLECACLLASWPKPFATLDHTLRVFIHKRIVEANSDLYSLSPQGLRDPTKAELEIVRRKLRRVFKDVSKGMEWVEFPKTTIQTTLSKDGIAICKGVWPSVLLANVLRCLERFGLNVVRRCKRCGLFHPGRGRKKFCSRRCVEADKLHRYKASPGKAADYNENHALLMWLKGYKVRPGKKRIEAWITAYRKRRTLRGLPVSKRLTAEVAARFV